MRLCETCNGLGLVETEFGEDLVLCSDCDGKGVPQDGLPNPAEVAFKILSDLHGLDNVDVDSFLAVMAEMDTPIEEEKEP